MSMDNRFSRLERTTYTGQCTPADVPELARQLLRGFHVAVGVEAARGLRKVLSLESALPVDAVVAAGAVPLLVLCLDQTHSTELQFEAAWALTNVASTDKTRTVVDSGAVPGLVRNLKHHDPDVREQCAWCLGNIAGDCVDLRDVVLGTEGALNGLLMNVTQPHTESLLKNCVWALSNMCRGKPQPDTKTLAPIFPVFPALLGSLDEKVLLDACCALMYVSDGDKDRITAVMSSGVVHPLVGLLRHDDWRVVSPALKTLGNFVSGTDNQTQEVLGAGVLPHLEVLLTHAKEGIRKETCWMLSNIVAGTPAQISVVCNSGNVVARVIEHLKLAEWDVQKEANFVISNIATAGQAPQVQQLVQLGAIHALCEIINGSNAQAILVALEAISAILSHDDAGAGHPWSKLLDDAGGVSRLEQLQDHESSKVYDKAVYILERFFS